MIAILIENPLLLLFIVAAIGYGVGSITIRRSKMGVAAVLFVGLAFGALDEKLNIPDIVFLLGLAIFVYTVGLTNGPGFFSSFNRKGAKTIGFIFLMQALSALIAIGTFFLLDMEAVSVSGVYAGAMTNTPALAALIDTINGLVENAQQSDMVQAAVVGYSISYPMGVFGAILAIALMRRVLRVDYRAEEDALRHEYPIKTDVKSITLRVTKESGTHKPLRDLIHENNWTIVFGRMKHETEMRLVNWDMQFEVGDIITLAGSQKEVEEAENVFGERIEDELTRENSVYEFR
ncbi:MAG: hypothetical protein AAF206_04670, partial [Bacteroidota bacterium]